MQQNSKKTRELGPLISVLANIKGIKQTALASACSLSRITINRFFKGHSEVCAEDLAQILSHLGFDLRSQIKNQLADHLDSKNQNLK